MEKELSLKQVQSQVDDWIRTLGVKYFEPLTNLGILIEESGELARIMVRLYGEQSFKKPTSEEEAQEKLEEEMADVFWVLVCLANQMDIDLEQAFKKTMDKKTKRDATRHLENEKLRKD